MNNFDKLYESTLKEALTPWEKVANKQEDLVRKLSDNVNFSGTLVRSSFVDKDDKSKLFSTLFRASKNSKFTFTDEVKSLKQQIKFLGSITEIDVNITNRSPHPKWKWTVIYSGTITLTDKNGDEHEFTFKDVGSDVGGGLG
jgi:hypothetical protein